MKKMLLVLILFSSMNAYAVKGSHGGQTVDVDGNTMLLDFVTNARCHWVSGEDIMDGRQDLERLFNALAEIDWYFAFDFEREMKSLHYCLTGALRVIDTSDPLRVNRGFEAPSRGEVTQVAIRINNDVYLDYDHFQQMSANHQAYTLVHEAVHSYIAVDNPMYYHRVKSVVNTLSKVAAGIISTTEEFYFQLERNNVLYFANINELNQSRDLLSLALMTNDQDAADILLAQEDLAGFFDVNFNVNQMYQIDVRQLRLTTPRTVIQRFCALGMREIIFFLLEQDSLKHLSPTLICLSTATDQDLIDELIGSDFLSEDLYGGLLENNYLREENGRIVTGVTIAGLFNVETGTQLLDLRPFRLGHQQGLSPEIQGLADLLKFLVVTQGEADMSSLISKSEKFYQLFGINDLVDQVRNMEGIRWESEREIALSHLVRLYSTLLEAFKEEVLRDLSTRQREVLEREFSNINRGKLGY